MKLKDKILEMDLTNNKVFKYYYSSVLKDEEKANAQLKKLK